MLSDVSMKKISNLVIYLGIFIYLEIIFKVFSGYNIFEVSNITVFIYILFLSLFIFTLSQFLGHKLNKVILFIITIFSSLWFIMQYLINDIYQIYFSLSLLGASGQVWEFKGEILGLITANIWYIILIIIPIIALIIFNRKIVFRNNPKLLKVVLIILTMVCYFTFSVMLLIGKDDSYSSYKLFYEYNEVNLSIKKLGVINTMHQDVFKSILGFKEKVVLTPGSNIIDNKEEDINYDFNNLNIDFDNMLGSEEIINMNNYFKAETGTYQNEYTGYFEGKNVIYIMAESFNEIAVSKDATPTLYKLVNEGFNFENYYSPTISSTIGGEFQLLTGLYPASGFLDPFKDGENANPYGLANVFKDVGYNTYAYHNNTYTFQNRYKYLPSIGFDNFLACNNGLEKLMSCSWLASDVDMINTTVNDYAKSSEPFLVFYATVSGHGGYSYGGEFTKKYLDLYEGLGYSEGITSYLSAQVELDRALSALISNLEKENKLDDTVIVLTGDHYPYMLSIDEINEASSYEKDEIIEVNKNNLIIWNNKMEGVTVDKVGSQIDVLPTVYNLFNIDYDSRIIVGKDILSTEPGLAIFANRSWISDYGRYYAQSDEFIKNEGVDIPEDYVSKMNQIVASKINISSLIMTEDYYKYLEIGD